MATSRRPQYHIYPEHVEWLIENMSTTDTEFVPGANTVRGRAVVIVDERTRLQGYLQVIQGKITPYQFALEQFDEALAPTHYSQWRKVRDLEPSEVIVHGAAGGIIPWRSP